MINAPGFIYFFTRRDKKALRVKAIIIPAGNSSKNNGKTRAINVKWWCDFFLKVWLFKFIIDSSPPLKNKWGSGEQSAVSSRSNFVALTCLQIKRGKLPAGGEVAERSEELRKRERASLHERVQCSSFCSLFFKSVTDQIAASASPSTNHPINPYRSSILIVPYRSPVKSLIVSDAVCFSI